MGTGQTNNNRRQDTQRGKSEGNGKSERRKKGAKAAAAVPTSQNVSIKIEK